MTSLDTLKEDVLRPIILRAKDSWLFTFLLVFISVIFVFPLIRYLQTRVTDFPYLAVISYITTFVGKNLSFQEIVIILALVLIYILLFIFFRKLQTAKLINEFFSNNLDKWSIPLGSGWNIQDCDDRSGKMLSVEESPYPGTLKETYSWYDYKVSFWARMDSSTDGNKNIDFVIRSESSFNGILLRLTDKDFLPHLMYSGFLIFDDTGSEKLPTLIRFDTWVKIRVTVKGKNVEIKINDDYTITYKIPTKYMEVSNIELTGSLPWLTRLESHSAVLAENKKKHDNLLARLVSDNNTLSDEETKELESLRLQLSSTTVLNIDYQKGAIGFRKEIQSRTHIRRLIVHKL